MLLCWVKHNIVIWSSVVGCCRCSLVCPGDQVSVLCGETQPPLISLIQAENILNISRWQWNSQSSVSTQHQGDTTRYHYIEHFTFTSWPYIISLTNQMRSIVLWRQLSGIIIANFNFVGALAFKVFLIFQLLIQSAWLGSGDCEVTSFLPLIMSLCQSQSQCSLLLSQVSIVETMVIHEPQKSIFWTLNPIESN